MFVGVEAMRHLPKTKRPASPPNESWRPGWRSDSRIAAQTAAVGEPAQNRGPIVYGDPRPIKPRPHVGSGIDYIKPARDALSGPDESEKLKGYAGPSHGRIRKANDERKERFTP